MATAGDRRGVGPERAFCRPLPDAGAARLDAEEAHHLARVRRVEVGDEVVLFDGQGGTRLARLVATDRLGADVEVVGPYPDRAPLRNVVVATAWPEGSRADDMVSTLAELGVFAVIPLRTAREAEDPTERVARRQERFARLAREAAKVNGRSRLLVVEAPQTLASLLDGAATARVILLDPDPSSPALVGVLGSGDVRLLVGPVGGFTDAERAAAEQRGVRVASVGACALRTETAAVAAAAVALAAAPSES